MRAGSGRAVLASALVLMLTGCGSPGVPQPRAEAVPVDGMVCSEPLAGSGAVPAGTIPADVEVVAVLQCIHGVTIEDAEGLWAAVAVERYEGDLDPFLAAVAAPNEPRSAGPCPADMVVAPDVWAETAEGRFLRLSFPLSGCGQPRGPASEWASAALAELEPVDRTVTRIGMTESFEASSVGCAPQAAVLTIATGTAPAARERVDPPEVARADEVAALRVCVYETQPLPEGMPVAAGTSAGLFQRSHDLRTSDAQAAVAALADAAPAADICAAEASRIAVAHPILRGNTMAAAFTVELDGCGRAVDPALRAFVAPAGLLALLTPPA